MPHLTVRVSDVDLRELRAAAALDGVAVSELVRRAVRRQARSALAAAGEDLRRRSEAAGPGPWMHGDCPARLGYGDPFCRGCGARVRWPAGRPA